jgi:hypothetical protein
MKNWKKVVEMPRLLLSDGYEQRQGKLPTCGPTA